MDIRNRFKRENPRVRILFVQPDAENSNIRAHIKYDVIVRNRNPMLQVKPSLEYLVKDDGRLLGKKECWISCPALGLSLFAFHDKIRHLIDRV